MRGRRAGRRRRRSTERRRRLAHRPRGGAGAKGRRWSSASGRTEETALPFDELIVAVGRKPRLTGYGLEALGIDTDRPLETNAWLETLFPNIYAVGDVAGPYQFTHAAVAPGLARGGQRPVRPASSASASTIACCPGSPSPIPKSPMSAITSRARTAAGSPTRSSATTSPISTARVAEERQSRLRQTARRAGQGPDPRRHHRRPQCRRAARRDRAGDEARDRPRASCSAPSTPTRPWPRPTRCRGRRMAQGAPARAAAALGRALSSLAAAMIRGSSSSPRRRWPGQVKTRLIPALGAEGAAALAAEMLQRTAGEALAAAVGPVELCADPDPGHPGLARPGPAGRSTSPPRARAISAQRLARAARRTIDAGERVILIGTDCPELDRGRLRRGRGRARAPRRHHPPGRGRRLCAARPEALRSVAVRRHRLEHVDRSRPRRSPGSKRSAGRSMSARPCATWTSPRTFSRQRPWTRFRPTPSSSASSERRSDEGELQFVMPFARRRARAGPASSTAARSPACSNSPPSARIYEALGTREGVTVKPINVTVNFMRGGTQHDTFAAATVTRLGNRVANVEAHAWQLDRDQADRRGADERAAAARARTKPEPRVLTAAASAPRPRPPSPRRRPSPTARAGCGTRANGGRARWRARPAACRRR